MLDANECARILELVQSHRPDWISRYPGLPFYTLGAASYLDGAAGPGAYARKAAAFNSVLETDFGWLYERLLQVLGDCLQARTTFEPQAARPGFHVFLAHEAFKLPLAKVHFDLQFMSIDWSDDQEMDFSSPVSYTLAIRMPHAGAGLRIWNLTKPEWDAAGRPNLDRYARDFAPEYVPYREGELICHSGMVLHQIAPAVEPAQSDDMRVTLQGHALPGRDGYRLYW